MTRIIKKHLSSIFIWASAPFMLLIMWGMVIPNSHMPMFWAWFLSLTYAGQVHENNKEGGDVVK